MKKNTGKKKKFFGLFALGSIAAVLAACRFKPSSNYPEAIYGPPEMFDPVYDPSDNENNEIYGPPEMFEDNYDSEETSEDADWRPDNNIEPCIYGPPEDMN